MDALMHYVNSFFREGAIRRVERRFSSLFVWTESGCLYKFYLDGDKKIHYHTIA